MRIDELLYWCFKYFYHRDWSNAAVHNALVRFSPITFRLAEEIARHHVPSDDVQLVLDHLCEYTEDTGR